MADFPTTVNTIDSYGQAHHASPSESNTLDVYGQSIGGNASVLYIMRAEDAGRPSTDCYITWSSVTPDFDGDGYAGGLHQDATGPIGAMVVGSAVVQSKKISV